MEFTIRNAENSDHDQLRKLVKEVHDLHVSIRPDVYEDVDDPFTFERFQSLLVNESTEAYVVSVDHEIAAYTFVKFIRPSAISLLKQYPICYIDDFCVKSIYHRKGIGKKLFDFIKARALEKEASTLDLTVWEFNENAIEFYKSLGMTTKNRRMELKL